MLKKQIKRFTIFLIFATTLNLMTLSQVQAQDSTAYLRQIAQNTYNILQDVNNLPSYLQIASQLVQAWLNPDNSQTTGTIQQGFTQLGTFLTTQNMNTVNTLLPSLNNDLLNNDGNNVFKANAGQTLASGIANSTNLGYANDLVYSTFLGTPFFATDPRQNNQQGGNQQGGKKNSINPAYNYIKNASGLNIFHPIPGANWGGSAASQLRYQSFYNTVMAVSTFNAYALGNTLYSDYANQFNTLQTTLIKQATDPKAWFAQVASENVGFVLRQILLYQSQTFVLLTQMIQLQKQAIAAQVMTSSVLVANNLINENLLIANAKGQQPTV